MDSFSVMDEKELFFFEKKAGALPLYKTLRNHVLSQIPGVELSVKATQISFFQRRMFACVSFNRVRPGVKGDFLTVTFGLGYKLDSPRLTVHEPYPGRWTHHIMLTDLEQIDGELLEWLKTAARFSAEKR